MPYDRYRVVVCSLLIAAFGAGCALADGRRCARCGGSGPCRKVCRLVVEEKSISDTCWGCKCEDYCLPGPSSPGCKHCEMVCGTCDTCRDTNAVHAQSKPFVWTHWIPGTAKIYTKKKLMKKTVTMKVPSHKWVVEDLCAECSHRAGTIPDRIGVSTGDPSATE
jgi:hypothetical protein